MLASSRSRPSPTSARRSHLDVIGQIMQLPQTAIAKSRMDADGRNRFGQNLVARQAKVHDMIRAGDLRCPTLVMWDCEDPSATMTRCGIPSMNLVLPYVDTAEMHILDHAGHEVMRERPESFNAAVIDFIGRHGQRA